MAALKDVIPVTIGVTPHNLLADGLESERTDSALAEAGALLHERDILQIGFGSELPPSAVRSLLNLLRLDTPTLRERGGPAVIWADHGHPAIQIEQVDYRKVLADRPTDHHVVQRDDLWMFIVRAILERHKWLDVAAQRRLLEIAGSSAAINELASDVSAGCCTPDGSPLLTTQAATILAAYEHLRDVVELLAPERREELLQRLAESAASLNPGVVMEMMGNEAAHDPDSLQRQIASRFDQEKVAALLATMLAAQGATERLADVFNTLAPDEERRQRLMASTRGAIGSALFGQPDQFKTIWSSMEELLVTYDEKRFVSGHYRANLDRAAARARDLAARDLPPELDEWAATLDHDNVRKLSVTLLLDLLEMEEDEQRATQILGDMASVGEDLLLAGDYETTAAIVRTLARRATSDRALGHEAAKSARDDLARSIPVREAVAMLGEMTPDQFAGFRSLCLPLGTSLVDSLRDALLLPDAPATTKRASDLIASFGPPAVPYLAVLTGRTEVFVLVELARVLGRIGGGDAVGPLQSLLRSTEPRVIAEAVRALARIDDPAAARAIQLTLRTASGSVRQAAIDVLVADGDARVVPVIIRILNEARLFGADHALTLEALRALVHIGDDRTVLPLGSILRRRSWLAPRRTRAVRVAAASALIGIGSARATAMFDDAAKNGDYLLRRLLRGLDPPQPAAPGIRPKARGTPR